VNAKTVSVGTQGISTLSPSGKADGTFLEKDFASYKGFKQSWKMICVDK